MENNSEKNFDIKIHTTFKIGGKIAEVFFPENIDEFIKILDENEDIEVFGNLSNTLVSSNGYEGRIILTTKMDNVTIEGNKIIADCGIKGPRLAQLACSKGLSGFEFMIGFPGSIGGEVFMNASANSQAISDKLTAVTCYSKQLGIVKYSKEEMNFGYRSSRCQNEDLIVLQAEFELDEKNPIEIQARMNDNLKFRKSHQPLLSLPNCGSIFKNPDGDSAGRLLDSVGAKEMKCGGVRVWESHANFIVNDKNGTSADVLNLMFQMYTKVKETYNIELKPEIVFLGGKNKKENEIWQILNKK